MILISHSMKSVLLIQLILSKDKRLQIYFDKNQFVSSSALLPQPGLLSLRCSPGRRRSPHPVLGVGGRHQIVPGTGHQAPGHHHHCHWRMLCHRTAPGQYNSGQYPPERVLSTEILAAPTLCALLSHVLGTD